VRRQDAFESLKGAVVRENVLFMGCLVHLVLLVGEYLLEILRRVGELTLIRGRNGVGEGLDEGAAVVRTVEIVGDYSKALGICGGNLLNTGVKEGSILKSRPH